jgi:recombination protein RecT
MSSLVSTTPLRSVTTVKEMLANKLAAEQLGSVAASHLSPERMMRTLALSVSKTPKLAECTPLSLLGALMTSASLGLEPNTPLGHAYLVPFDKYERGKNKGDRPRKVGTEAQLVIGYRGYIQLAHNSGQVASLDAAIHYESDPHWKWRRGTNAVLEHEPGDETGAMLHAYAICEIKGGGRMWVCWPEAKLVAHRDRYSKGYAADIKYGKKPTDANVNIWLGQPDVARMKTMVRQLAKIIPMATEIPQAALYDGARANYAQFAMDPSQGRAALEDLTDDGTGEIDAEVLDHEDSGGAAGEQGNGATPAEEKTAAPDPKTEADAAKAKLQAAAGKAKAEPAKPAATLDPWISVASDVSNSLLDLSPERASEAIDVYSEEEIEAWKKESPESFAEVMAAITERENAANFAG